MQETSVKSKRIISNRSANHFPLGSLSSHFSSRQCSFIKRNTKELFRTMQSQHRSPCPVACTLDVIGDKWTLLVVRDMLLGRTQFKEFSASPEKIATNILSDRLNKLVEHGLAERQSSEEGAGRVIYQLTPKGKSLKPVIRAIANWGLKQIDGTEIRLKSK